MKTAKHITDRIRLLIATKQFQVGEVLPSTRVLGKQLGASFHTVRKAYKVLEEEGLLQGETGRGFVVKRQNTKLDKAERLEKGAEKFRDLLEELIGYGLDEEEVETLFQEQLNFMDWPERINSCATVGKTKELGSMLASTIRADVGIRSQIITTEETARSVNFDALFVPVEFYRLFRSDGDNAMLLPVLYSLKHELIISIIERSAIESIGIICKEEKTLPPLLEEVKQTLKFPGSITAGCLVKRSIPAFIRETDLILYTESCANVIEDMIPERKRTKLEYELSEKSAKMIRSELWDDY